MAAGWDRRRELIAALGAPVTARLIELVGPRPGETILEIACGNGEVGLAVAARLPDTRLIQSDFASEMVDVARRETQRRRLVNVDHRVLDAERLDLPDASVDAVVCRWGYMLTPDPTRALTETCRVLRPGGRVALAVWAERERNPWGTMVAGALLELGLAEPPEPDAPGPFRLGERARLLETIRSGGLEPDADEELEISWPPMPAALFWEAALEISTTLRGLVEELPEHELAAVRRHVEHSLQAFAGADGLVTVPGVCRVLLARRDG